MNGWSKRVIDLAKRQDAATLVEYTLVMMLIAASCFAVISSFGGFLAGLFQRVINGSH